MSVMSSLSYRKRSNLKDSIGGAGDESSLFSTLKEQSDSHDRSAFRKAKSKSADGQDDALSVSSWKKSQAGDDLDDRGSVISQAYSEATSRARKGLDRRWSSMNPDFDKESMVSSVAPSRASTRRGLGLDLDDDAVSSVSGFGASSPRSLRRSASWRDDGRSDSYGTSLSPGLSRRSGGRSPGSVSLASLARSSRLSEFGVVDDDGLSVACSESRVSAYSPHSAGRSFSVPPQARSAIDSPPDASDVKPVSHRNYLDPDLEAAINEVLSFKPIKFKRRSLEDSAGEDEEAKAGDAGGERGDEDDRRSVRSVRSALGDVDEPKARGSSSVGRRSASALDLTRPASSSSSIRSGRGRKGKKKSRSSDSESSSPDERRRKSSKKKGKKSKRSSKRRDTDSDSSSSSSSESSSSSSSSGASTISYRSSSSVKKGPAQRGEEDAENGAPGEERALSKRDEKKKKKKVDNLMMKYLYRPDSD